ncbi:MAG: phenol 2-monooxygenase [Microbacterium sp. SCN 70-200]|uniref:FAD-dependent monooxygenase n=1 Tax=unclassified Microbacterium TaxID=2609290 RepID=UPI00086A8FD5|nr:MULTISPECIES: FAD-dependent monooxygenase [unclassified Microbacterium]MBN9215004.1 FAD-dependent monooxygenase [Microbacterium sp.]ODT42906.1 MAG: phenol 2-monooxygenase [Microbacterium sp. SCN 70-200]OJV84787.1 MAG: phenol 2-monooxygenase [Microbacterium sp. 70-16]
MQFYRAGYRPGDPDLQPAAPEALARGAAFPDVVDVLVVGTGPAGAVLTAQLAAFPDITTRVIERREGPLQVGHADGVACRTVEMFQAFGLADALLREAYWVGEVRFWGPSDADRSRIERTGWVEDTPAGLSEFPHVIVNQARMQQYLLEHAARSSSRLEVDYGIEFVGYRRDESDPRHPLVVTLRRTAGPDEGTEFTVRASSVVGCDGARSAVRRALGIRLEGDAANHAWGVMDVLAVTHFPDWRTKNVVQSAGKGTLLMIPREGGNMVRCYVDLGEIEAGDTAVRATTAEQLTEVANAILHPYSIDVRSVVWSSVYEVGQRLADRFDDLAPDAAPNAVPRLFLTGDACHTHSAKAGQGMNVSMQDAFNLGWKLAAVLQGRSDATLLRTYSEERQRIAADLIAFDRHWSSFIAQPALDPAHPERGGVAPADMQAEFARQGRYTAGLATTYSPSRLTGTSEHQELATGFEIGRRFHAAPVRRIADGRGMHLGHTHVADGRWRVYAFGDETGDGLRAFAQWWTDAAESPARLFAPGGASGASGASRTSDVDGAGADADAVIDVHGIFRGSHHDIDVTSLPAILLPTSGPFGLQDWEKAWAADPDDDIFTRRGIARAGAIVIVRPDQYVAHVLPLGARAELGEFFRGILMPTLDPAVA